MIFFDVLICDINTDFGMSRPRYLKLLTIAHVVHDLSLSYT